MDPVAGAAPAVQLRRGDCRGARALRKELLGTANLWGVSDVDAAKVEQEELVFGKRRRDALAMIGAVRAGEQLLDGGTADRQGGTGETLEQRILSQRVIVQRKAPDAFDSGGSQDRLFGDSGKGVGVRGSARMGSG